MLNQFITWILLWIYRMLDIRPVSTIEKTQTSPVLDSIQSIQTQLQQLPDSVRIQHFLDPFLLNQIDSKFKDVGHIFEYIAVFRKGIGEQLNDPSNLIAPEDERVSIQRITSKPVIIAHFHTQDGRDMSLKDTFDKLEKEIEILGLLYTQILFHPTIDKEYRPYLDRRLTLFLSELARYISAINTHGQSHDLSKSLTEGRHL